jgi:hypothetical protein
MIKKLTFLLFLFAFACLARANAQTAAAPEKQAALKELVALVNSDNKAEELLNVMLAQIDASRDMTYKAVINERTDLTPAEKKALEETILIEMQKSSERFKTKFRARLNYSEMINEVTYIVYDKHYTLEELKDLIAFYKTPTGQKVLKTMPVVAEAAMKLTQERLLPKIPVIIQELMEEDRREIEQQINSRKPKSRTSDHE